MTATAPLPRGTVTFLFTDIEGSTRLLEQFGDDFTRALLRHRDLLSDAVCARGGVIVRTEGDAVFVAFEKASDAVSATIAAQHALAAEQWPPDMSLRVRMGMHTGEVDVVGEDYVGMSVHIAARVSASAHGGQILLTEATARLAGDPDALDLGRHRLKDVGEFRLFQVVGKGLPQSFPEPRTLSVLPNNLPAPVDSFVGRHAEMTEVSKAVATDRLVTLTGAGGSGKTRLALETGASVLPDFPDGVWLVELVPVSDGHRVTEAVAQALRVSDRPGEPISETLEGWLKHRALLLILDNCEHIVEFTAAFCDRLLPACPGLQVLATSREILGARGEHAISTPPLNVRDDGELISDAVQLFVARAAAVAPSVAFDASDLRTVAQVCRRLDGLPLAIELAAARMRALSIHQLMVRLDDRFRILTGRHDDEASRQRTLEAVVAWSYDLLSDSERQAFDSLSVFPDHFTLEMAEVVVGDPSVHESEVMDLVSRLVDKSLVSTVIAPDGLRYKLLETLRQYGLERLEAANAVNRVRRRLFVWAMSGVESLSAVMRTPMMDDALREATINAATYRAVIGWALDNEEATEALRIASLVPIIHHRGERRAEILRCLEEAERTGPVHDLAAGEAWAAIGNIAFEQADSAMSREANRRAIKHFRAAGHTRLAAWAQYIDVHAAWSAGQLDEVDRLVSEAITRFRREGDDMGLGYSLWVASLRTSDLDAASDMAAEADRLLRSAGVPMGIAHNTEGRGIIAFERGNLADAAQFVAEAVEMFASYGNLGCTAHALEAAAVLIGARERERRVAIELIAAAEEFRLQSGQGHRPWEIRARIGPIEDRIAPSSSEDVSRARESGRLLTLSGAATLAAGSLLG
jgi:predicted ATPase/class 3 adenylate cyclase